MTPMFQGKAANIYATKIEPIFKAAGCSLNVIRKIKHLFGRYRHSSLTMVKDTTHQGHAFDVAKALNFNYDAIVTVSGDGLIHEVINGFANHKDPARAFAIPIAPIPTGSGNAMSLNLLGLEVLTTSFTGLKALNI
jgi:sphingosine kinase